MSKPKHDPYDTFENYLIQIDVAANKLGLYTGYSVTKETGEDCWRECWEDKMTPEEAAIEGLTE